MTGAIRKPRAVVLLNGNHAAGWISFEVDNNVYYQADTATVVFAVSALPEKLGADWFASQEKIEIEVYAGFPANTSSYTLSELDALFVGRVDSIDHDPVLAEIEVQARDFSADFIDAKTTEKWQNQTPGDIVRMLAERRGLKAVVTDPGGLAGTYYSIDHAKLNSQRTEWDLLTYLAHETGSRVFVRGRELHFESIPDEASKSPYLIEWKKPTPEAGYFSSSTKALSFSRSLTVAKDVVVRVKSWNAKSKTTVEATAIRSKKQGGIAEVSVKAGRGTLTTGDAQLYSFTFPGLTQEQALQKAQELRRQISSHEMKLTADLPADNQLSLESIIQVSGTGTAFDQNYYPSSIVRKMSVDSGYTMTVNAKNHSPESEVAL